MQLNFDASQVAPAQGPVPIETGWYPAQIILTEQKPTKNGGGSYLEITFRISSGPNAGRTLKDRLNLQNANQQAVDIAYGTLSAICHATGRMRVGLASELHGGALEMFVKKTKRNDKPDEDTNEISGYRALGAQGNVPGFTGAQGSQVTAAPAWASPQPAPSPAYTPPAAPAYAPPPAAPAYSPAPTPPAYPQPAPPPPAQQAPAGTPPWANEAPPAPAAAEAPAPAGSVPPWAR